MDDTKYLYGLTIKSTPSLATCVKIIRKHLPLSITEIQDAISSGKYIYTCMCYEEKNLSKMIKLYKELSKAGAELELFDDGTPLPFEFLVNQHGSVRSTRKSFGDISDDEI